MTKSDAPSAAEFFIGMPPLDSVKSQEEAKGKCTLTMYDICRAHFHGVPVRRLFIDLSDEEKETLAEKMRRTSSSTLA